MQRITITSTRYYTRYRRFSLSLAWVAHNVTHYHNFKVLPHQYHTFSLSFILWFWGYLQRITTSYRQIYKEKCISIFFKKLMLTRGNPLQIT